MPNVRLNHWNLMSYEAGHKHFTNLAIAEEYLGKIWYTRGNLKYIQGGGSVGVVGGWAGSGRRREDDSHVKMWEFYDWFFPLSKPSRILLLFIVKDKASMIKSASKVV